MPLKNPFKLSAGDTIVEVMVVLAVLGLSISTAYATANRSLLNTRQAQENSTATELAQAQIEQLRTLVTPGSTPDIFQTSTYCIDSSNSIHTALSPYPPACEKDSLYDTYITYVSGLPVGLPYKGGTFTVMVQWPDVTGQGTDSVTLTYRIYQQ